MAVGTPVATQVVHQSNAQRAELWLEFDQRPNEGSATKMVLKITNKTPYTVSIEAAMSQPLVDGLEETSIVAIPPGKTSYEVWPDPIVQLILHDIRLQ